MERRIRQTKRCPHCGYIYKSNVYSDHNAKDKMVKFGKIYVTCPQCQQMFRDSDIYELAIMDPPDGYLSRFTTANLVMAAVCAILGLIALGYGNKVIGILGLGAAAVFFLMDVYRYYSHTATIKEERERSMDRIKKDNEYAKMLKAAGFRLPDVTEAPDNSTHASVDQNGNDTHPPKGTFDGERREDQKTNTSYKQNSSENDLHGAGQRESSWKDGDTVKGNTITNTSMPADEAKRVSVKLSEDEIKSIQELANKNYPGLAIYVRDVNLKNELVSKYRPGMIIRVPFYTDASNRVMGMITSHRYMILSNHMADFSGFEHGTNWGLHVAARDSHFKVLGIHTVGDKTAIILLHLPDNETWKFYIDHEFSIDQQLFEQAKTKFEAKFRTEPIPELTTQEWLNRCSIPLGISNQGILWELD